MTQIFRYLLANSVRSALSSYQYDKISDKNNLGIRSYFAWQTKGMVHHGGEGIAARSWRGWLYYFHSQKTDFNDNPLLVFSMSVSLVPFTMDGTAYIWGGSSQTCPEACLLGIYQTRSDTVKMITNIKHHSVQGVSKYSEAYPASWNHHFFN